MSVTANDLKFYLTGAASDGGVQADPNASLGNYKSLTEIISGEFRKLWDDVGSAEAGTGDTEYRCVCLKNEAAEKLYNVKIWWSAENDPNDDQGVEYAVETPETAHLTDGNAQTVINESTTPIVNTTNHNGSGSGISDWSSAMTKDLGLQVNQGAHGVDLDAGEVVFVWIKRIISASSQAQSSMSNSIRLEGDTL